MPEPWRSLPSNFKYNSLHHLRMLPWERAVWVGFLCVCGVGWGWVVRSARIVALDSGRIWDKFWVKKLGTKFSCCEFEVFGAGTVGLKTPSLRYLGWGFSGFKALWAELRTGTKGRDWTSAQILGSPVQRAWAWEFWSLSTPTVGSNSNGPTFRFLSLKSEIQKF